MTMGELFLVARIFVLLLCMLAVLRENRYNRRRYLLAIGKCRVSAQVAEWTGTFLVSWR